MMRAVIVNPATWQIALGDWEDPSPGSTELLVEVRAAGVSRGDLLRNTGKYLVGNPPKAPTEPFVGGGEFAGIVTQAPSGSRWSIGDRVMGMGKGWAELAVIDERLAMPVPDDYSWEQAAATPASMLTAHNALRTHGRCGPGDVVLIHAVTSGVGVAAALLARHFGAHTIGTSRSAEKLERMSGLELDLTIDVSNADFATAVHFHTDGHGADITIDNVGASVLAGNIDASAIRGRIIQVGRLGGQSAEIDLDELARKRIELIGVTFRTRSFEERADLVAAFVEDAAPAFASGAIRPLVDAVFPFAEASRAQALLSESRHIGKIVIVA